MKEECKIENFNWVDVKKELPEYMTVTLVYTPDSENVFLCYYYFHSGSLAKNEAPIWAFFGDAGAIIKLDEEVTHWMKPPNPPLEEEK